MTTILIIGLACLLVAGLLFILLQDFLVFPSLLFGSRTNPEISSYKIHVERGVSLEVTEIPGKVPMLCLHGNGETVASFSDVQIALAKLGFHVYQFDYRGIGNSSGWPSEAGIYKDADTVLQLIATQHGCHPKDVVIMGQSIGTGPATYLAE